MRATRRAGFGGASGRAASKTASRRSAQHRVPPGAFVLHHLQRRDNGSKIFKHLAIDPKKPSPVLKSRVVASACG